MNIILCAFVFILFYLPFTYQAESVHEIVDVMPDFIGYLLLWFMLEKRQINRRMKFTYTAVSVMTVVSFLVFFAEARFLAPSVISDFLNGDGMILNWILTGLDYLSLTLGGVFLMLGAIILGLTFFSLLEYWEREEKYKKERILCIAGLVLSGIILLCGLGSCLVILPFSWNWITYPVAALSLIVLWATMRDSDEMINGIRNV